MWVRLKGPAGNPTGVGPVVRLKYKDSFGPAREIHAGSGYWSQDSTVQVLGTPEPLTQIQVHWPGGKTTTSAVPPTDREIVVDTAGSVQVLK
jgi:hypothetical protein